MNYLFGNENSIIYYVKTIGELNEKDISKLIWLFGEKKLIKSKSVKGEFIGPRKEMITPWSTNAVEISNNMGIIGIERIEEFISLEINTAFDPMISQKYSILSEDTFYINEKPNKVEFIEDINAYNKKQGLALSIEEVKYLENLSKRLKRKLSDSEVFGFSQVNSEHCRHKIFNGIFNIDGKEMPLTLFQLIRKTSNLNYNKIVSAYSDNVAFIKGPKSIQFAPSNPSQSSFFEEKEIDTVISLKAETHNFPTTVEPFNGAATGSGGEIRDRMAGGKGSSPLVGTAVYMTAFTRLEEGRVWENNSEPRKWLYQNPVDLLIKASNGASDFGNKFGQPLINGSVFTFEYFDAEKKYGFDKVIMLAGGVGYAKKTDSHKDDATKDDLVVVMGGDNYRIGMGGSAVSSVATGEFENSIELNAVQRSNPEMQKRVFNAIRGLSELDDNPIISIHDHGAGGHLNALSELVETSGGIIEVDKLPIGDITLSSKEMLGNESQERMGLLIKNKDLNLLNDISKRERAPMFVVGKTTGDMRLQFLDNRFKDKAFDLELYDLFGNPPKTVLVDKTISQTFRIPDFDLDKLYDYTKSVLQMESVACKDWLTNKVDRSVSGKVALQQNAGVFHLPLNNLGVTTIDFKGEKGIANSIGHAPVMALCNPISGSRISIAKALTNIVWAPIDGGLKGISLSANWMWPAKNEGENTRLYRAVEAISDFAIELGINIPTGKDSLSMKQKYPNGDVVFSPGTVIISAVGEVSDIKKIVSPVLQNFEKTSLLYIDFSNIEDSIDASSFSIMLGSIGNNPPTINDSDYFTKVFNSIQELIKDDLILAGHDISSGGKITSLLEMTFSSRNLGLELDISEINTKDIVTYLFSENPGVFVQVKDVSKVEKLLKASNIKFFNIGKVIKSNSVLIKNNNSSYIFNKEEYRDEWYRTSYLLDSHQTSRDLAKKRFENYKNQELRYKFPESFLGNIDGYGINKTNERNVKAAIIREKGINGDREMAYALYLAGFDVKDVHMTDLISGKETLDDIKMIVFPGGFSNSDVLGSAKGWAGAILYNEQANKTLKKFYERDDTMSLGVCNGCQLMGELDLIYPEFEKGPRLLHNDSQKFESAFLAVEIKKTSSIMLNSLVGSRLGVWIAHGEGKFSFPTDNEKDFEIPMKYAYDSYPGNPNGSQFDAAAICSKDGRHLAMMPHLERAIFPWQWAHYEKEHKKNEVSPWIEAFVNAKQWLEKK